MTFCARKLVIVRQAEVLVAPFSGVFCGLFLIGETLVIHCQRMREVEIAMVPTGVCQTLVHGPIVPNAWREVDVSCAASEVIFLVATNLLLWASEVFARAEEFQNAGQSV